MGKIRISERWAQAITWLMRLVVGCTFIYSGFVKAVDPMGTFYKVSEYLAVMHFSLSDAAVLSLVFLLFSVEFLTGVLVFTGSLRRFSVWVAAAFMAVMLPLTVWIAIYNPVSDCGCFGDAWVLSNTATMWKNVVLTLCIVWLLIYNRRAHWLITPALQWIEFVAAGALPIIIGVYAYAVQPPIDFRQYKVGEKLFSTEAGAEADYVFIYEKEGEKKEFKQTDSLPDEAEGWTFVDRREIKKSGEKKWTGIDPLTLYDPDTSEEDMTEEAVGDATQPMVILLMPEAEKVSVSSTWKINELYDKCREANVEMIAVTHGSKEQIDDWTDISMAEYPIYTSDDTLIKEIARGNPAVVYLQDGHIKWKTTLRALDTDALGAQQTFEDVHIKYGDAKRLLMTICTGWVAFMGFLILASFMPKVFTLKRHRKSHEEPEETNEPD